MARRPKDIGTAGETAVVRYARGYGYPHADRQPPRGHRDQGDIIFSPGLIGEVKAGDAARYASDTQVFAWLEESLRERDNAKADLCLLVIARWRQPVDRWWAILRAADFARLGVDRDLLSCPIPAVIPSFAIPVRLLLRDALTLTRTAGYGDPPTPSTSALEAT